MKETRLGESSIDLSLFISCFLYLCLYCTVLVFVDTHCVASTTNAQLGTDLGELIHRGGRYQRVFAGQAFLDRGELKTNIPMALLLNKLLENIFQLKENHVEINFRIVIERISDPYSV